ncbi:MAG: MlaD family protein [Gammaproteobacteria bacterium]|jgi:phospholipid/cholesterol/gamma-HCH transport system substrate-binding protein/paraquat-inducible protein B
MIPSKQTNYFRIGSFVMLGIGLIILGIILLSSGRLFTRTITVETYFSESIQGLSDGSPVKYRGVEIGHINKISFVHQIYKPNNLQTQDAYSRYVYVEMIITPNVFTKSVKIPIKNIIQHDVSQGLRIKLALQGLTGNAYLELNFVDPQTNIPLHIDWKPKNYYIPSAPSTLTQFSDNAQIILEKLKKVHFQKIGNNTIELMQRVNYLLSQTEQQLQNSINNSAIVAENLRAFSGRVKNAPSQILFGQAPPKLNPGKL